MTHSVQKLLTKCSSYCQFEHSSSGKRIILAGMLVYNVRFMTGGRIGGGGGGWQQGRRSGVRVQIQNVPITR